MSSLYRCIKQKESNKDFKVAFCNVGLELQRAIDQFPSMRSAHEGWAIVREEVDELWKLARNLLI